MRSTLGEDRRTMEVNGRSGLGQHPHGGKGAPSSWQHAVRRASICGSFTCSIPHYDDWLEDEGGAGPVAETQWKYVGEGQGEYAEVPKYDFVGTGRGNFQKEITYKPKGRRTKPHTICIVLALCSCILLLLFLGVALVLFPDSAQRFGMMVLHGVFAPLGKPSSTAAGRHSLVATTTMLYTCTSGPGSDWSDIQLAWCCRNYAVGCPGSTTAFFSSTPEPEATTAALAQGETAKFYDCHAGPEGRAAGWTIGKRVWCCFHFGRGCPAPSAAEDPAARSLLADASPPELRG